MVLCIIVIYSTDFVWLKEQPDGKDYLGVWQERYWKRGKNFVKTVSP